MNPKEPLFIHLSDFLRAVHMEHNASNLSVVNIRAATFIARQHKYAKAWAKVTAANLFPMFREASKGHGSLPNSPVPPHQAIHLLAQAMLAAHPSTTAGGTAPPLVMESTMKLYGKYGLCEVDMDWIGS